MSIQAVVSCVQTIQKTVEPVVDIIKVCANLYQIVRKLGCYAQCIPYVGCILATVEGMIPVDESKDVVRLIQKLSEQIKAVRNDISELKKTIRWESAKLQYSHAVEVIETGMELSSKSSTTTNDERQRFEERLKELCSNGQMTLAVNSLLKGLTGEGIVHNDILETIYLDTRGHRRHIELMCNIFSQLFVGGLAVISAYEMLVRGEQGDSEMMAMYEGDAEKLKTRFDNFQQKCKDRFAENMLADLNEVLDGEKSNKDAVASLSELLREKYDWLETYCIICKESVFIDYDFRGDHVKSLQRNDRFGVIFYRKKITDPVLEKFHKLKPRQFCKRNEVAQLIKETDDDRWFSDAAKINRILKASLSRNGYSLWGCATVKANRFILFPPFNIPAHIGSSKALNCFEISGTWTKAVSDVGGHKHLCLLT